MLQCKLNSHKNITIQFAFVAELKRFIVLRLIFYPKYCIILPQYLYTDFNNFVLSGSFFS